MNVLKVTALLLFLFEELGTSSSKKYEEPNMALKGFTYLSIALDNKYQCESLCWKSSSCRSVNFNLRNKTCELNYEEKETIDDLTPEEGILYIIPNDKEYTQPRPCSERSCKENELCGLVDAMRNHHCLQIDIPCQSPEPIPNAKIDVQDTSYKAKAEYKCDVGFEGEGDLEIECRFPGKWSATSKQCKLVNCSQLKPNSYAEVTLREPGNTTYGAKADQTCVIGFTMENGTLDVKCQADGNWSKPTGYCKARDCGPPSIWHGEANLTVAGNITYTATARVTCDTNYQLSSLDDIIRCLETGSWSEARCMHVDYTCDETLALCYKLVDSEWTWTEARSHCQQDGGDLIILDSDAKMDFIRGVLANRGGNTEYHIGGVRKSHNVWSWLDEKQIYLHNKYWDDGSPSNGANEDCIRLHEPSYKMRDNLCNKMIRSICEVSR